jgi:hypothetical protein|tara:strand:- start:383 stop:622 length:240 start_codon:yes stop_codon:yes gene_type:complete
MTIQATFSAKDQNNQNESTIYWFDVTEQGEEDEVYGIVESGSDEPRLLDCDGCPFDLPSAHDLEVVEACVVTEEMRLDY